MSCADSTYFLHELKKYAKTPGLTVFHLKNHTSFHWKLEGSVSLHCLISGHSILFVFLIEIQKGHKKKRYYSAATSL